MNLRALYDHLSCLMLCALIPVTLFLWTGNARGAEGVRYEVTLEGVEDSEVRGILESFSTAVSKEEEPPATLTLLKRRVSNDVPQLTQALKALGYYSVEINAQIDESKDPVQVVFRIDQGPVYLLKSFEITREDQAGPAVKFPSAEDLGLKLEEPALARSIIDASNTLIRKVMAQGFPFAKIAERRVVVDHSIKGVLLTFNMDLGPQARFGATTITGLKSVEESFVRRKLPWKRGDRFDVELLTEAQKRLTSTNLFSLIRITHADSLQADGALPMNIEVSERKHRTVRAGVSYATDEGAGATASWEHRNLFHRGERFKTELTLSQLVIASDNTFQKTDFFRRDQSLNANLRLARDDTDAFTSDNAEGSLIVKRDLMRGMKLGAGPGFRLSRVDQASSKDDFALIAFPTQYDWDTSDNLLDPTRGGRLKVQASPFYDLLGRDITFFKGYASYTRYWEILEEPLLLFASRAAAGAMGGTDRDSIPADVRFYAGGGGSIRGFSFQTVGPLDTEEEPLGGRSLVEFSGELRWKITETVGVVTFLDGGTVFETAYPDFSETLRWGTGAGVRYFTPIGPLRLDVGVPINRREEVDDLFQVYISLGQAF